MGFATDEEMDAIAEALTGKGLPINVRYALAVFAAAVAREGTSIAIRSDYPADEGRLVITLAAKARFGGSVRIDGRAPIPDRAEQHLTLRMAAE